MSDDDFAFEPQPGIPSALPQGEAILWQGMPQPMALARRTLFLKPVLAYFAVLAAWRVGDVAMKGGGILDAASYALELLPALAIGLAAIALLSYGYARSTVYTITNRRVIVRSGLALPITVNLPFAVIEAAGVAKSRSGQGEIVLKLIPEHRVALLALWPHVRPGRLFAPEPLLAGLSEPDRVATILGRALAASSAAAVPTAPAGVRIAPSTPDVVMPAAVSLGGATS